MNTRWTQQCLDGTWDLYIAEHKAVAAAGATPATVKALEERGYLHIPGSVPGNFELDMEQAGLLPDLFYSTNTLKAQELENRHLWYARTFTFSGDPDSAYFDFEGIDTVAEIYLNGDLLATPDNMFIAHEMPACGLKIGENELVVHIIPAVIAARDRELEPFAFSALPYNTESLAVRKAAHMYGWDIMPRIISGGLWRSVYLFEKPADYLEDVYVYAPRVTEESATLMAYFKVHAETSDFNRDYTVRITGRCGDSTFCAARQLGNTEGTFAFTVEQPRLWWPRDLGEPNLYDVTAELLLNGTVVDTQVFRTGIRSVRLDLTDTTDEAGSGEFRFFVNGEPVFIRGTNWVPMDAFHSRDAERLPQALELLWESGCNATRCWGGNVYEDHAFFDFCDSHGILIWQDFAMGCATYPVTEDNCEALRAEAVQVVRKLRQHPSLMMWAGDNECDVCAAGWTDMKRDPSFNKLTREILPDVVRRQDPVRPYLASSPYVSHYAFEHGGEDTVPERHLWGPRDYYKSDFYTTATAHFASETGYHGCNAPESMKRFIAPDKQFPWQDNPDWIVHATEMVLPDGDKKGPYTYRIGLMASQVDVLFGCQPDNLADFALASQISEAEADKFFVERFRIGKIAQNGKWRRTGIIWWNLIDGWPQLSDAVVDYYGYRKQAFFAMQRSQQPVCLMFREPENGVQALVGANETRQQQEFTYTVTDLVTHTEVLAGTAVIPANAAVAVASLPEETEAHFYVMEWTVGGKTCRNHYVTGKPPYDFKQFVAWLKEADLLNAEGFPLS